MSNVIFVFGIIIVSVVNLIQSNPVPTCTTKCDIESIPTVSNFDVTGYLGIWYELSRINHFMQGDNECVEMLFGTGGDNSKDFQLETISRNQSERVSIQNRVIKVNPLAEQVNGEYEAHVDGFGKFSDIKVIDTDYKNWAVVWSCGCIGKQAWILSRTKSIDDDEMKQKIETAKSYIKLDGNETWRSTIQLDERCN